MMIYFCEHVTFVLDRMKNVYYNLFCFHKGKDSSRSSSPNLRPCLHCDLAFIDAKARHWEIGVIWLWNDILSRKSNIFYIIPSLGIHSQKMIYFCTGLYDTKASTSPYSLARNSFN